VLNLQNKFGYARDKNPIFPHYINYPIRKFFFFLNTGQSVHFRTSLSESFLFKKYIVQQVTDIRKRWSAAAIFNRIGISKNILGESRFNQIVNEVNKNSEGSFYK
jgi:hypothetical protein